MISASPKPAPLSGTYLPTHLSHLSYGPGSVSTHLPTLFPTPTSKAFIITTTSLSTKTPHIKTVESLLTPSHHAGTFGSISAHAPISQIDTAATKIHADPAIDTIISIGGGSPIDAAKALSHRVHSQTGHWLHHIAIPTTISVAEVTGIAGFTDASGQKTGLKDDNLVPNAIIYDADFVAGSTPVELFLSTGIRALDHAVELMYHPDTAEVPTKHPLVLSAIEDLFTYLPLHKEDPGDRDVITRLQLASFNALYPMGLGIKSGLGLSHSLGYALGAPYGIPHGITSCVTLAGVVSIMAESDGWKAGQIARILPHLGGKYGGKRSGDDGEDARKVAEGIEGLVGDLGLSRRLEELGVGEGEVETILGRGMGGAGKDKEKLRGKVEGFVRSLL